MALNNHELLKDYSNTIRELRKRCIDAGMDEEEFKKLYLESLHSITTSRNTQNPRRNRRYTVYVVGFLIFLCFGYNIKSIYSCLMCNLQDYIYPGFRLIRRLSIPFISLFPSLTDFYHETCLIQNPFFTVVDMDCWPCSTVNNVREVTNPGPTKQHHTAPFIYETDQMAININAFKKFYTKNQATFDKESPKLLKNNKQYVASNEIFQEKTLLDKNFYIWKFNNMNIAKVLRQLIPRPEVVPKFGQSTERFIIVENSQTSFRVPDTECSYSFLLSLSGSRQITLVPAEECKHQCKSLTVHLKETYLLWYNWWYWRPIVQSSLGNTTFIAHVGSYC